MFLKNKKSIVAISCLFLILIFGSIFKIKNDQKEKQQHLVRVEELRTQANKNKSLFMDFSAKRAEIQFKILNETRSMNSHFEKLISESKKIQFVQQEDFNLYELKQNEIQNVITQKIREGLNSKDKKWRDYFQKNMKQLELVERDLNQARMKFSENIYELSKKENKKAVTFLSDTALIENLKLKK